MAFTAKDVQALRERTGVGMMDCKKALVEADGDMDKAIDFLREKGLAAAAKKSGRIAAEGVVLATNEGNVGVIVEVNSETDFVAKNAEFQGFVADIAKTIIKENPADVDALLQATLVGTDRTVEQGVQEKVLSIGENIKVRRFERVEGVTSTYVHGGGRIGVIVLSETDEKTAATDTFKEMGKDIAMQIAAINPLFLDIDSVPADTVEKEKEILLTQIQADEKMANKPEKVLQGIITGKIGKYFKENCLMEQQFVKDGDYTVKSYVEAKAKELGADIKIKKYIRFERGEGLQKREDDFAAEVAGMMK